MNCITQQPSGRARLLSFDGGGIRGLFALQYPKRIETLLREKTGKADLVLSDHFHYIGGTSTAAIIAAFLSWGLPVSEIEGLYRKNAIAMFTKSGRDKHALDVLSQAKNLPTALIGSFQPYQDLLCRVHGECRYGSAIDDEVGALMRPSENPECLYARYDKIFSEEDLAAAQKVTRAGFTLDNLELMDFLCEVGAAHAEAVVKLEHFDDE